MNKIRVLIVEDERLAAEDLSFRLKKLDFSVIGIVSTGKDAIKLAAEANPDIILMDIQLLGNIDGIEAARLIHKQKPIPVIFASAYGDDAHITKALKLANPYGFLHKPVDDKAALTMIKIAMSRFNKDQVIRRINLLLKLKDRLYRKLSVSQTASEISTHVSNTLASASMLAQTWMMIWEKTPDFTFQDSNGLPDKAFQNYLDLIDYNELGELDTVLPDKVMAELIDGPAYLVPLRLESKTIGVIGFSPIADVELDSKELAIVSDISQLVTQTLQNSYLLKEKESSRYHIAESEDRLKAIVEKSTTGIFLVNDQYQFEYINDRLCHLLGREKSELIGSPFIDYLGSSRELVTERYIARQDGEDVPSEYEIDFIRPDGEIRNAILTVNTFKDALGRVNTAGHLLDITDQKMANLELSKLSKAVEQSPVMTVITDPEGTIEFVNAEFTKVTGYSPEEAIGQNPRILKSGLHDKAFYEDLWATITSGKTWTGEITNKKKNGEINWEKISISPIRDAEKRITHYVAVKEDISQFKREQEKAQKNQKLRDILYGITSAAIKANDVATVYENVYQQISQIISTSNFLVAMLNKEDNRIYFPFERDHFDTDMPISIICDPQTSLTAKTIISGKMLHVESDEIRQLMLDGQVRLAGDVPSVWLGIPLKVKDEIIGAFVLQEYDGITQYDIEDVHLLNLAADQVALTIDRARKDDALRELAVELTNANGMKELLLDIITHDLRNPAGVISAITEMLEAEDNSNEMYEILKSSSDSLMKVIENATVLSKLSIGESIAKEDFDLVPFLSEIVSEFSSQLATVSMKLEMHLPETLMICANPILSEIPKNYISNAIKYASEGQKIDLILGEEEGRVVLRVNDYGTLIPEDKREAVFHRSVQLARGEKKGRGLGLAIVQRIATAHDADVGVERSPTGGNSFYLKL